MSVTQKIAHDLVWSFGHKWTPSAFVKTVTTPSINDRQDKMVFWKIIQSLRENCSFSFTFLVKICDLVFEFDVLCILGGGIMPKVVKQETVVLLQP